MSPHTQRAPHLHVVAEPAVDEAVEPRLLVIEGGFSRAARALRMLSSTLLVTFVVGLVGALVVQATLIENQRDLDEQRSQIETLRTETESMRHQLAELEAPARIVAEARALGMIEAPSVTYLHTPSGALDERTMVVAENQLAAG